MSDITIVLTPEQREQFTTLRTNLFQQASEMAREINQATAEMNGLLAQAQLVTALLKEPEKMDAPAGDDDPWENERRDADENESANESANESNYPADSEQPHATLAGNEAAQSAVERQAATPGDKLPSIF